MMSSCCGWLHDATSVCKPLVFKKNWTPLILLFTPSHPFSLPFRLQLDFTQVALVPHQIFTRSAISFIWPYDWYFSPLTELISSPWSFVPFAAIDDNILEAMKPGFMNLPLDATIISRLINAASVMDIYNILLSQFNNNFRQLVLTMKDVFPVQDEHQVCPKWWDMDSVILSIVVGVWCS